MFMGVLHVFVIFVYSYMCVFLCVKCLHVCDISMCIYLHVLCLSVCVCMCVYVACVWCVCVFERQKTAGLG